MRLIASLQIIVLLVLSCAAFATQVWALVDAARRPDAAYLAAGKRNRRFWLLVLAVAAAVGFLGIPPPIGLGLLTFVGLIAVVPAIVYLVDVRPAISRHGRGGPRRGGPSRGGGW